MARQERLADNTSTASHTPQRPKGRAVFFTGAPCTDPEHYRRDKRALMVWLPWGGASVYDPTRLLYGYHPIHGQTDYPSSILPLTVGDALMEDHRTQLELGQTEGELPRIPSCQVTGSTWVASRLRRVKDSVNQRFYEGQQTPFSNMAQSLDELVDHTGRPVDLYNRDLAGDMDRLATRLPEGESGKPTNRSVSTRRPGQGRGSGYCRGELEGGGTTGAAWMNCYTYQNVWCTITEITTGSE